MRKLNSNCAIVFSINLLAIISLFLSDTAYGQNSKTSVEVQTPDCFAKVGNIQSGNVQLKEFTVQEGVIAYIKVNTSHWEPIIVNGFSLIALRDSSIVFQFKNNGKKFESEVRAAFQYLRSNDVVLIYSIQTYLDDKQPLFVNPLEFKIAE